MTRTRRNGFQTAWTVALGALGCSLWLVPAALGQMPVVQVDFAKADSEIPITQWQLLGPFRFDKKVMDVPDVERQPVGLNRDYFRDLGLEESSMDAKSFFLAKAAKTGVVLDKHFGNRLTSTQPKTNILQLALRKQPVDYAVAYAGVIIESPRDQDVVIAAGADDSMQIWLNEELLFADANTAARNLTKFNRLIGASLKKGSNFLMVKVCNLTLDWQLMVNLYAPGQSLILAQENAVNPILYSSVVATGAPLELRGDLLHQASAQLQITNREHISIDSSEIPVTQRISWKLEKLKEEGVYRCRVSTAGQTIERPFYYGNLEAGYSRLSQAVKQLGVTDETVALDLEAQLSRLKHLLQPASRTSEFWDQKVVASFVEIEDGLKTLHQSDGSRAFREASGTHIRAYRSPVDEQVQQYWIHVPEKALRAGKPIQLVIVPPFTTSWHQPFLESYFLAAFDETERYRILGDEYGFAVLQVWGRGNHLGGTAIGTADVFDALKAVQMDYTIDPDRVYLLGSCEGGRLALLLGERYPDRFAAIATLAPITAMLGGPSYASRWTQYSSPIATLSDLHMPVLIRHDEADTPPPIQESEAFVARSHEAGLDVSLVRSQGGLHGFYQNPMAEKRALFEFFRGKQRPPSTVKVATKGAVSGFGVGHGPIEDAFGSPVLVVEGTIGSATQSAVNHDLVEEIRDEWRKAYFVDCPTKRDTDVSEADLQKYNLVIVGDRETNKLVERMAMRLPVRSTASGVSLAGKNYSGSRLGYEFISPNPLNSAKYVVVIGMNQWVRAKNWKLHPSRDGIVDYFVFDLEAAPKLVDAGYFDSVWQQPSEDAR